MPHFVNTPYTLPVHDIVHRPGEMREHTLDITVPEDLGAGQIAVVTGQALHVDVRLEGLHEGILVSGTAIAEATGQCSRCLIDISEPVEVDFAELFAYDASEEFDYLVHDDHVDCEPVIRDAVVLALPFQPVCRPDCPGLDPVTGERLADVGERDAPEVIDPRWAALTELRTNLNDQADVTDGDISHGAPGATSDHDTVDHDTEER